MAKTYYHDNYIYVAIPYDDNKNKEIVIALYREIYNNYERMPVV